jgi:hypothetical protein
MKSIFGEGHNLSGIENEDHSKLDPMWVRKEQ